MGTAGNVPIKKMNTSVGTSRSPLIFFFLVFVISVPFWAIGALTERFLAQDRPINLPVSALMFCNPMIIALVLTSRENGTHGVKRLLQRPFDYGRIQEKIWYLPIFLLMPLIMVLEYGLMNLMGKSIPGLQFPLLIAPILFGVFFISAIGEEIGWTGYVTDPLQDRWNALGASIILGIVWAVWHIVPYIQAHNTPIWILWQCAATVVTRVLIVWLYNNTGKSTFAAVVFHALVDVGWALYGPNYDPFIACVAMAVTAAIVTFLWGPKTLARYRYP